MMMLYERRCTGRLNRMATLVFCIIVLGQHASGAELEIAKELVLLDVQKTEHLSAALLQSRDANADQVNLVLMLRNHGAKYYPLPPARLPHFSVVDKLKQPIKYELIVPADRDSGVAFGETQVYHIRLFIEEGDRKVFNLSFKNATPKLTGNTVPSLDGGPPSGVNGPLYTVDVLFNNIVIDPTPTKKTVPSP